MCEFAVGHSPSLSGNLGFLGPAPLTSFLAACLELQVLSLHDVIDNPTCATIYMSYKFSVHGLGLGWAGLGWAEVGLGWAGNGVGFRVNSLESQTKTPA